MPSSHPSVYTSTRFLSNVKFWLYTFKSEKIGDNKITHDLIVFIYLESLLYEIKMMIQFSH